MWDVIAEDVRELRVDQMAAYDALVVLLPRVTAASLDGADRLAIIACFGVGYDSVDIDACTPHGVLVTVTPDGVRRAMATAILTSLLALSHRLLDKDRLTRAGGWTRELDYMGTRLTGRVLGSIRLGNIGRELGRLAAPLEMCHVAHDPYGPLYQTPESVAAERLALMKPTAYLISTARASIVDQQALTDALRMRRIAGAALDVFEDERADPNDPLLILDNVIVSPHALFWTDEWANLTGRSALGAVLEVAAGRVPGHVVNRDVLETPLLRERLRRYADPAEG